MTTEFIALLITVFAIVGVVRKVATTFDVATPKLGARVEKHIETGAGFTDANNSFKWQKPPQ